MPPRVWFITGTSTGLGRLMAELVLKQGEVVIATARKPEVLGDLKAGYPASQLLIVKLDVDNPQDITDAFTKAKEVFGRIDVVLNNAGWAVTGEIEGHPEEEARKMFDTNFWGASNVSKEAVRFFRDENKPSGGLLLNNSALNGVQAQPGLGYYAASKYALEGLTQALAGELDPAWNIKVSLIELGPFYTTGTQKIINSAQGFTHPAYTNPTLPSVAMRTWFGGIDVNAKQGSDPAKAVQRIYELSLLPDPPLRLPLGKICISGIKAQLRAIEQDLTKYETWSDGLEYSS